MGKKELSEKIQAPAATTSAAVDKTALPGSENANERELPKTDTDGDAKATQGPASFRDPEIEVKTVQVPVGPRRVGGHQGRAFIETRLDREDAARVARVADALSARGARLKSGRMIKDSNDVLAWLAQQLDEAV